MTFKVTTYVLFFSFQVVDNSPALSVLKQFQGPECSLDLDHPHPYPVKLYELMRDPNPTTQIIKVPVNPACKDLQLLLENHQQKVVAPFFVAVVHSLSALPCKQLMV